MEGRVVEDLGRVGTKRILLSAAFGLVPAVGIGQVVLACAALFFLSLGWPAHAIQKSAPVSCRIAC